MFGVLMYGCPEAPVSSKRRSSIRMPIRFGFIGPGSVDLDVQLLDQPAVLLEVVAVQPRELLGRAAHALERRLREALAHRGEGERLVDLGIQPLDRLGRRAGR